MITKLINMYLATACVFEFGTMVATQPFPLVIIEVKLTTELQLQLLGVCVHTCSEQSKNKHFFLN